MSSVNLWKQRVLRVTQRNRVSIKGAPATALEDMGSPITEAVKLQLSTLPTVKQVQLKLSREKKRTGAWVQVQANAHVPLLLRADPQPTLAFS